MPNDFVNLYVAQLPPGEDAYDTAHRDPEQLKAIIAAAKPWYQHVFDTEELGLLESATGIAGPTPEARSATVRRLVVVLRSITDPVLQAHYTRRLATIGLVDDAVIEQMVDGQAPQQPKRRGRGGVPTQ